MNRASAPECIPSSRQIKFSIYFGLLTLKNYITIPEAYVFLPPLT